MNQKTLGFEDMAHLFTCDNRNRGIIRMNFDEAALLWKTVLGTSGDMLEIGRYDGGSTELIRAAAHHQKLTSKLDVCLPDRIPVQKYRSTGRPRGSPI